MVQDGICGSEGIEFDLTPQPGASYSWNFGDGTTSTQSQPTHIYALDGGGTQNVTVTLTVTTDEDDGACAASSSQTISILQNPNPGINDLAPLCPCVRGLVHFLAFISLRSMFGAFPCVHFLTFDVHFLVFRSESWDSSSGRY